MPSYSAIRPQTTIDISHKRRRASLLTSLGLRAASSPTLIPNLTPHFIIWNFFFSYGLLSSRTLKQIYGIDHNASPREDLQKYGPAAVASGKITQSQLNMLKRNESAHANSVEHFAFFMGAMLWANLAGLDRSVINSSALAYSVVRFAYAAVYIGVEDDLWSQARGLLWWTSNIICFRLFWLGGKLVNSGA